MKSLALLLIPLLMAPAFVFADDPAPADPADTESTALPTLERPPLSRFRVGTHFSYWNARDLDAFDFDGFLGGGVLGQMQLIDPLALEVRLSGFATGYSEDVFIAGAGWYENSVTLVALPLEAGFSASLPLADRFDLYAGAGVGLYLFDGEFRSEQGRREESWDLNLDSEFGGYALLGLRSRLARNAAVYVEAKYTAVETSLKHEFPSGDFAGDFSLDQDLDLSGLALQAGFLFTF